MCIEYGGPKVHARLAFVVCSFVTRFVRFPSRFARFLSFVPCYSYFTFLFPVACELRFPFSILRVTFSVPTHLWPHIFRSSSFELHVSVRRQLSIKFSILRYSCLTFPILRYSCFTFSVLRHSYSFPVIWALRCHSSLHTSAQVRKFNALSCRF